MPKGSSNELPSYECIKLRAKNSRYPAFIACYEKFKTLDFLIKKMLQNDSCSAFYELIDKDL